MSKCHYDYAILGGGAAGLSMLCHLHRQGALEDKRLLIVEPLSKDKHDRTWSFWEREAGPFEDLVFHRWKSIGVHNYKEDANYSLDPLSYKLIRSTELYAHCDALIASLPNVDRVQERAEGIKAVKEGVTFKAGDKDYIADWAFSSLPHPVNYREINQPYLDQHFRGWFIRSEMPVFDPDHAHLMDFRTPQCGETRFFYVLPVSTTEAMVEIAIFSNDHLTATEYDQEIENYLAEQWPQLKGYEVYHTEQGVIPMTTYPYPAQKGHLIYIGLGGGYARPSSGYTFYNLQKRLGALAESFVSSGQPGKVEAWPRRHLLYDATILDLLQGNRMEGADIFPSLFATNPTERVLDFLNGETTILDELRLMSTTNIPAFGTAFLRQLTNV